MSCPSCGAALPPDARFCPDCGTAVGRACSACGHPLGPQHRFCAACGALADERPAAASSPPRLSGAERRVSSVLFGDLVGFTTLSESRDPEEVRDLLSGYFDSCREVVARYGGTIEKFIGDAVMAVWGVPRAHEDDAERAVRAGLDLVDVVAGFGERAGAEGLAMRVGVVTGEVAVTLGATNQGMVAGDAVNTAARVQAKADPGSVWVDEQTRALTSAAIAYEAAGVHELKGKAEPVVLHRATAVMGVVGGVGRELGVEAPLVGRRRELSLLKDVYQAAVEDGRGRLLVVAGGPGVGKSRLGWELQKYTDGLSAVVWMHWGRCAAYGDGVTFSALSVAVRRRIEADDDAPPAEQRERLRAQLAEAVPDPAERDWLEPRLAVLLGGEHDYSHEDLFAAWLTWFERIGRGGDPVVWVIDDAHHADDALLDFVEHVVASARFPFLVVLLARQELLDRRPRLAVSRRGTVIGLEGLAEQPMGQLFDALVVDLPRAVRAALVEGSEGVPLYAVETVRAMLDRGLVVEEDDHRRLAPGVDTVRLAEIGAPTSLQMLIGSRLDALPAGLRELVQYASVLGNAFSLEGLAAVSGRTRQEVADDVEELAARDLIKRVADRFSPDFGRYAFVQAMVRQVAYRTQSRQARLARHLAAADYLRTQAETSGELVAVVAQHLADALSLMPAGDPRVATLTDDLVGWLERSGQRAMSLGVPEDAVSFYSQALGHARDGRARARLTVSAARSALDAGHWDRAIALAVGIRGEDPLDLRAEAATVRGDATRFLGRPHETLEVLAPFLERSEELSSGTASAMLRIAGRAYVEVGDVAAARPLLEGALRRAEETDDAVLIGWALNDNAALILFTDLRRMAAAVLDDAIGYCEAHHATGPLMALLINRGMSSVTRDLREALRYYDRALEQSRAAADAWSAWLAATALKMLGTMSGRWSVDADLEESGWLYEAIQGEIPIESIVHLALDALRGWVRGEQPAVELKLDTDSPELARRDMGQEMDLVRLVHARLTGGLAEIAQDLAARTAAARWEFGGTIEWYPYLWATAVDWLLESGAPDDVAVARRAITTVGSARKLEPAAAAQLPRLRAAVALADRSVEVDGASVEHDLREAITALEAYGALPDRARAQLQLGRLLTALGHPAEALPVLSAARDTFVQLDVPAWVSAVDAVLTRLPRTA